jgi:arsenate reductase (glutaredoxin)
MNNKIYHLSSCSTNVKILKQLPNLDKVKLFNIKENNISPEDLDYAANQLGSYEALFSKKAQKYRLLNLHLARLSDQDYRTHILEEYTFLKRPVAIINGKVFAGNTNASVAELIDEMSLLK